MGVSVPEASSRPKPKAFLLQIRIRLSKIDRQFHLQSKTQCRRIRGETGHDGERIEKVLSKHFRSEEMVHDGHDCHRSMFLGFISGSCTRIGRFI